MLRALISTVVVLLAFVVTGWAQPTFTQPVQKQNQGDRFCMEVTVKDFTDICTVRFWMKWNPNVLKFEGVEGFNLNNLSTGNFDLSAINDGVLGLNWDFPTPNQGVTLADGQTIFRI